MNADTHDDLEITPFHGDDDDEDEVAAVPLLNEPPYQIPRGKYKGLVLPRMIGVKPSLLDRVQALMEEIARDPEYKQHASSIAETYAQLRREAEAKADELNEVKVRLTAVMQLMIGQYENEDILSLTTRAGDTIRIQPEPHLIVMDPERFRLWCLEAGHERSLRMNWGTANKMVKQRLLDGIGEPEGTTSFMRPKVFFSRGENKRKKP